MARTGKGDYEGRYLNRRDLQALRRRKQMKQIRNCRRWMAVVLVLLWDGVLLYMIVHCLIDSACGAVFMSIISVYMGYQMN